MAGLVEILNDSPIEHPKQAAFGFDEYSRALTSIILDAKSPITIGIFGKWGTGKTSLMTLMYNELSASKYRERAIPLWFNAWRYQNENHLILPLLYTIREKMALRQLGRKQSQVKRFVRFLDKFIRALSSGLEVEFPVSTLTLKYSVKESLAAAKEMAKDVGLRESPLYYDAFRYLEHAIAAIGPSRLVVFLDDLDRCTPEKLLQMLETIKLMLGFTGLVFVVGVNHTMVERAVVQKYGVDSGIDGDQYVKKLIQVVFAIPALRPDDIKTYVRELVADISGASTESIARIIAAGAGSNPREIKRLVNNFSLTHRLNPEKTTPEKTALLLVLQQRWPSVYQKISEQKVGFLEFGRWFRTHSNHRFDDLSENDKALLSSFSLQSDTWEFLVKSNIDLVFSNTDELDEYLHFASIASYPALQPGEIEFHHVITEVIPSEQLGAPTNYRWRIMPAASDWTLEKVDRIVYRLPASSYRNRERIATAADDFAVTATGWSNVDVRISVCLRSGEVVDYTYYLDLGTRDNRQILETDHTLKNDVPYDASEVLLAALRSCEQPLPRSELIKLSGIAEDQWNAAIRLLLDAGKVAKIGRGSGTKYTTV